MIVSSSSLPKSETFDTPRFSFELNESLSTECKTPVPGSLKSLTSEDQVHSGADMSKKELYILMENVFLAAEQKTESAATWGHSSSETRDRQAISSIRPFLAEFMQKVSRNFQITILTTKNKKVAEDLFQKLEVSNCLKNVLVVDPRLCLGTNVLKTRLIWECLGFPSSTEPIFLTTKGSCQYYFDSSRILEINSYDGSASDSALMKIVPFLNYFSKLKQSHLSVEKLLKCFQLKQEWQKSSSNEAVSQTSDLNEDEDDERCQISNFVSKLAQSETLKTKQKLK